MHLFKEQCYLLSVKTQKPPRHLQYTCTYITALTTLEHVPLPRAVVLRDTLQTYCPKCHPTRHTNALWRSNSLPHNLTVLCCCCPIPSVCGETSQIEAKDRAISERPTTLLHGWSGPPRQSALFCSWQRRLPSDLNDFSNKQEEHRCHVSSR